MKLNILIVNRVLFTAFFLTFLGFAGYLAGNSLSSKILGKSVAGEVQSASVQGKDAQLQALLDNAVTEKKSPGAVMYISTPKGTWIGASGVSDVATKTLMKPTDGFAIASTSKTFVAVVVLQLASEGTLNLNEAIASYLPEDVSSRIPNSETITVRQLLNHTSGVAEYLDTDDFKQATERRSRQQPWTAKEAIPYMYNKKAKFSPGEKFAYTDSNYILLELIVEEMTGGSLEQAMRDRILNPLGLKRTFTELRETPTTNIATGYGDRYGKGKLDSFAEVNDGNGLGDGGLVSTAEDLGKFASSLFGKKSLLSRDMMQEMLKFSNDGDGYGYGLGVERFPTPYGKSFGHSGIAYGFRAQMLYVPSKDTTVVVLLNNQSVDSQDIAMKGLEIVNN